MVNLSAIPLSDCQLKSIAGEMAVEVVMSRGAEAIFSTLIAG